ncbi:MAG: hypothetical protein VB859_05985, partial [Planctomycetaceae bacterium]
MAAGRLLDHPHENKRISRPKRAFDQTLQRFPQKTTLRRLECPPLQLEHLAALSSHSSPPQTPEFLATLT